MTKALKRDLISVVKSLKVLTQKTEKIAKKLDKLEKSRAAKRPKAKAVPTIARKRAPRKAKKATATATVLGIIKRSRKGVDTATLKKKTGFKEKKIWDIVNRARSQGKVKSPRKGVYVKA